MQFYPLSYGNGTQIETVLEEPGGRVVNGYGLAMDDNEGDWAVGGGTVGAVGGKVNSAEVGTVRGSVGFG